MAPESAASGDSGIPGWTLILTGLFGLGVGVTLAWLLMRRRGDVTPEPVPKGTPARV
jgi:hypothetical protein